MPRRREAMEKCTPSLLRCICLRGISLLSAADPIHPPDARALLPAARRGAKVAPPDPATLRSGAVEQGRRSASVEQGRRSAAADRGGAARSRVVAQCGGGEIDAATARRNRGASEPPMRAGAPSPSSIVESSRHPRWPDLWPARRRRSREDVEKVELRPVKIR
jgi:hypothetical protein